MQAKETLFNPIRTEIFKIQYPEFEKILLFFNNKTEFDFIKAFDLDNILSINASRMIYDFTKSFYPDEEIFDADEVNRNKKEKENII